MAEYIKGAFVYPIKEQALIVLETYPCESARLIDTPAFIEEIKSAWSGLRQDYRMAILFNMDVEEFICLPVALLMGLKPYSDLVMLEKTTYDSRLRRRVVKMQVMFTLNVYEDDSFIKDGDEFTITIKKEPN